MSKNKKPECEHKWVRVWLRSNNYQVKIVCKKCFVGQRDAKKTNQPSDYRRS